MNMSALSNISPSVWAETASALLRTELNTAKKFAAPQFPRLEVLEATLCPSFMSYAFQCRWRS